MQFSKMIETLQVLRTYCDDDSHPFCCEHDVLYITPTKRPMSPEDVTKLVALGWFQENGIGPADDVEEGEEAPAYDPDEGWMHYV